ncbi:MAG TPA: hypothetical protein VFR07_09045 [Mycobacteriales bacterium]|nr:hypothetical protein [Mycobacteriales bacterium]
MTEDEQNAARARARRRQQALAGARARFESLPSARRVMLTEEFRIADEQARFVLKAGQSAAATG